MKPYSKTPKSMRKHKIFGLMVRNSAGYEIVDSLSDTRMGILNILKSKKDKYTTDYVIGRFTRSDLST